MTAMPFSDRLLKTRQVAAALGVSVSTVKRWVDAGLLGGTRTVGKHRLVRLREAVRFAQEQGLPLSGFAQVSGSKLTAVQDLDAVRERLIDAVWCGDERVVKEILRTVVRSGVGVVTMADHLIRPVMERVGHGWETGELDVFQEHQATQIIQTALGELLERVSPPQLTATARPLALGATPEGDYYTLALLLGELVLRESGWDVRSLGPNLPLASLANAVVEYRPRMVFLSVSHLEDETRFIEEYTAFYRTAAAYDVAVMLGGRALHLDVRQQLVSAGFGERLAHLAEFARRLIPASKGTLATAREGQS